MSPRTRPDNGRILVVDDSVAIHDDFRKILTTSGAYADPAGEELNLIQQQLFGTGPVTRRAPAFDLTCSLQGEDAVGKARQARCAGRPFAMAFVDMRMPPGWGGLETCVHLWEADPDVQVVICTAYMDYSWDEIVDRVGVSDRLLILKKPFEPIEVLQLAYAMTEKWNLLQQTQAQVGDLENLVRERTEELYKNHERLHLISRASNDAIWDWNISTGEVWRNEGFELLFGHPPRELPSGVDGWAKWVHLEDFARVRDGVDKVLEGQESFWTDEYRYRRRDGTYADVVSRAYVVRDGTGVAVRMIGAIQDVSKRKQAETARHMLETQLRQAQKLETIGQLAGGVAHEINTPMQYIGDNARFVRDAFSELRALLTANDQLLAAARAGAVTTGLLDRVEAARRATDLDYLADEIPKALDQTIDGVERVTTIVRAMKEFSHPGAEEKTQVDLNKAIESTLTICRNEWKYVAELVTDLDASLPPVPVIPGEFNQVILNLVINAAHAISDVIKSEGRSKGTITITSRQEGDWAEVCIRDTGTGIPSRVRDRIFELFFTTKGVGRGTGQGLALARSIIVGKHGGTLNFETEEGRGTRFIIRLPLDRAEAA